ncbi:MAG TPA: alpha/beta fold hydrolase [Ktedonobacteraceae bacterium]|nr:alpha/beta fold hydrolase [Ktedonobacteraceae bacterium]
MSGSRRWAVGLATSTGLLGLTVTSGLAMIAHYFVEEFSRPHRVLPEAALSWGVPKHADEPPRLLQRPLLFRTSDGTLLSGDFWAQPQPAPTIVLCHGYRISRSHLRPAAALQYSYGYNVLFFDFRGHGDSDSVLTSAGNAEVRDLEAALFVAARQPETLPGKIIIHGFSMGASVALLMAPHPDVVAIIADSPYARSDDIMRRLVYYRLRGESSRWAPAWLLMSRLLHYLLCVCSWAIVAMSTLDFRLRFGYSVVARPLASFKRWKALQQHSIPIFLIHSAGDTLIPIEHSRKIAAAAIVHNVPLETYFVDGCDHCGAYGHDPYRYDMVIKNFLERHLRDDFPEQHRRIGA